MLEALAAAVAFLSLGVSFFALWLGRRDAGRANFTVDWSGAEDSATRYLVLHNRGPGPAREVTASTEVRQERAALDQVYMAPGQVGRIEIVKTMSVPPPATLELSWRDNRLSRQALTLTIPVPPTVTTRRPPAGRDGLEKVVRELAREEIDAEEQHRREGW